MILKALISTFRIARASKSVRTLVNDRVLSNLKFEELNRRLETARNAKQFLLSIDHRVLSNTQKNKVGRLLIMAHNQERKTIDALRKQEEQTAQILEAFKPLDAWRLKLEREIFESPPTCETH